MKLILLLLSTIMLLGCSSTGIPEKLNGKVVKDEEGNYYVVQHQYGDNVFLRKLDLKNFKEF